MAITVQQRPARLTWDHFLDVDALPDDYGGGELAQIRPETDFPHDLPIARDASRRLRLGDFTLPVRLDRTRTAVLRTADKTDVLLQHEQGHHDLFFLAMRVLARDLEAIRASDPDDFVQRMQEARSRHQTCADAVDGTYDRETDHGRDRQAQSRWDTAIAEAKGDPRATHILTLPL